jgi:hypothetical protein
MRRLEKAAVSEALLYLFPLVTVASVLTLLVSQAKQVWKMRRREMVAERVYCCLLQLVEQMTLLTAPAGMICWDMFDHS